MIANSASRVPDHTSLASNERIRQKTRDNIKYYSEHPEEIELRLHQLDEEWDIERALETGSSVLTITGLFLGVTRNRKWFALSALVQGFFLQHALQGWCPPLPMLRRLGFRTVYEIEAERHALNELLTAAPLDV